MHLIGTIGFIVFGLMAALFCAVHEYIWWRQRKWIRAKGVIVGFQRDACDGSLFYHPEIRYQTPGGPRTFVSTYGSSEAPALETVVDLVVAPDHSTAENFSLSNRLLPTVISALFAILFIAAGIGVRPLDGAASETCGSPPPVADRQ